jgi:hypothetical protein
MLDKHVTFIEADPNLPESRPEPPRTSSLEMEQTDEPF